MATYYKGDVVTALYVWKENGRIKTKPRPGIIYDVIGQDYYLINFFGTDRTGKVPGIAIKKSSEVGIELGITKDSYLIVNRFPKLQKRDIFKLIGNCPDELMKKIDAIIDENKIKRPLN